MSLGWAIYCKGVLQSIADPSIADSIRVNLQGQIRQTKLVESLSTPIDKSTTDEIWNRMGFRERYFGGRFGGNKELTSAYALHKRFKKRRKMLKQRAQHKLDSLKREYYQLLEKATLSSIDQLRPHVQAEPLSTLIDESVILARKLSRLHGAYMIATSTATRSAARMSLGGEIAAQRAETRAMNALDEAIATRTKLLEKLTALDGQLEIMDQTQVGVLHLFVSTSIDELSGASLTRRYVGVINPQVVIRVLEAVGSTEQTQ